MTPASETTVPPKGKSARKRKSTPPAITATNTSVIPYDDAVSEGKEIVAKIEDVPKPFAIVPKPFVLLLLVLFLFR
jgi:hypothetical protein